MSLFVIADLHLSASVNKSMTAFGKRWDNYTQRIKANWERLVSSDDTVIIPGDISWGINLSESLEDFKFIDSLPGKKIILKGNHDLWWDTLTKINKFFEDNSIKTISLLQNNAFICENVIVCGSRGWFIDEKAQKTVGTPNYSKIISREVIRLRLSLDEAMKLKKANPDHEVIAFLHFPPVFGNFICDEIISVLLEYGVKKCYFGHIHDQFVKCGSFEYNSIQMKLISADYLEFIPLKITV